MNPSLGHEALLTWLRQSVQHGRIAGAYLFAGPDGEGPRQAAGWFAQLLNCEGAAPQPCGTCPACVKIVQRLHPDVSWLEGGETSAIKIDEVRAVINRLSLRPYELRRPVAVIAPAEALTDDAANALLKTLEEPRGEAVLVLVTTDPARCLPTLVSRCRLVRFGGLSLPSALVEAGAAEGHRDALEAWRHPTLIESRDRLRDALLHLIWEVRQALRRDSAVFADAEPPALAGLLEDLLELHEALDSHVNPRLVSALVHTRLHALSVRSS